MQEDPVDSGTHWTTDSPPIEPTAETVEHSMPDIPNTEEGPPPEGHLIEVLKLVEELGQRQTALNEKFETKIQYDQHKTVVIDRLHEEVESHRRGLHLSLLRPLALDLVSLYDRVNRLSQDLIDKSGASDPVQIGDLNITSHLRSYLLEIEEILRQSGFTLYQSSPAAKVDGQIHRVGETQTTDDPSLDACVAKSSKVGLKYERPDGKQQIIRPESVSAYKFESSEGAHS